VALPGGALAQATQHLRLTHTLDRIQAQRPLTSLTTYRCDSGWAVRPLTSAAPDPAPTRHRAQRRQFVVGARLPANPASPHSMATKDRDEARSALWLHSAADVFP
jgi:hypothetical protein